MSNVANVRYKYRRETLKEEINELETTAKGDLASHA